MNTWTAEHDTAKKRLDDWLKEVRTRHEPAARQAKIGALKLSDDEKTLLTNKSDAPEAKELAKKFAKEVKVEDQDLRALVSGDERAAWDERERALKEVEDRKPRPFPTAFGYADFGATPRETF